MELPYQLYDFRISVYSSRYALGKSIYASRGLVCKLNSSRLIAYFLLLVVTNFA